MILESAPSRKRDGCDGTSWRKREGYVPIRDTRSAR